MSDLREFLQLAHPIDFKKDSIGGWFMSEKLDGMRAFWDGGVTRGMPCASIPFANVLKHDRFVNQQYSTGLWSRYGQPIHAPSWWLDLLPRSLLDGELYAGRGNFQFVMSTTKDHNPNDNDWKRIYYHIFDTPPIRCVFQTGKINNTNFKKTFENVHDWFEKLPRFERTGHTSYTTPFEFALKGLQMLKFPKDSQALVHNQIQLPLSQDKAIAEVEHWLEAISSNGGEGLMIRKRESIWTPKRTRDLLKVKKYLDDEGIVIGYKTGEKTDKGSKLLGKLGSLRVAWKGKVFDLSGFTDEERFLDSKIDNTFSSSDAEKWAIEHPGENLAPAYYARSFPLGCKITFKYRELTDVGLPKEARYYRKGT